VKQSNNRKAPPGSENLKAKLKREYSETGEQQVSRVEADDYDCDLLGRISLAHA
jgi:hypothetical protein